VLARNWVREARVCFTSPFFSGWTKKMRRGGWVHRRGPFEIGKKGGKKGRKASHPL